MVIVVCIVIDEGATVDHSFFFIGIILVSLVIKLKPQLQGLLSFILCFLAFPVGRHKD